MIYVISDLHGYPLKKLERLLEAASFSERDFLYILGDVVDKNNDGGVGVLRWILNQSNVQLLLGNHEEMLLNCESSFDAKIRKPSEAGNAALHRYMQNGGDVTLAALQKLNEKSPQIVRNIFAYLHSAPIYKQICVENRNYLLVHSGIDHFEKGKALSDYSQKDFLWAWPELEDEYFDEMFTIFGHTPTMSYGEQYKGKLIQTKTWMDIDVGAAYGIEPVLFRLNDWKAFSLSAHES